MSDLDDYQLSSEPHQQSDNLPPEPPREERSSPPIGAIVGIIVFFCLAGAIYYWFFARPTTSPAEMPAAAESSPPKVAERGEIEEEPLEPIEIPPLDASDPLLRELVGGLASHPALTRWLLNEDLARRFVGAIDNVAEGEIPAPHIGFLAPKEGFSTRPAGGRRFIDSRSFRRFNLITAVFASLDAEQTAELYEQLEPLFQQAYRDLGYPRRAFRDTLIRALDIIVATPRPAGEIEVIEGVRSFQFADPRLESLLPVQKQLLGFGSENLARIQVKARALSKALAQGSR